MLISVKGQVRLIEKRRGKVHDVFRGESKTPLNEWCFERVAGTRFELMTSGL
jgi:hypothetical protein